MLRAARVRLRPADIEDMDGPTLALVLRGFEEAERNEWRRTALLVATMRQLQGERITPDEIMGEKRGPTVGENDVVGLMALADQAEAEHEARMASAARLWTARLDAQLLTTDDGPLLKDEGGDA